MCGQDQVVAGRLVLFQRTDNRDQRSEGREQRNFKAELEKLRQSKKLINDEFKQNMISRETYEELKMRYERDIAVIENEMRKNRITIE